MTQQASLDTLTAEGFEAPEPPAATPDGSTLTCKSRLAAIQRRICYLSPVRSYGEWDADELAVLVEDARQAGCINEPAARALTAALEEPPADRDEEWRLLTIASGKFGRVDDE